MSWDQKWNEESQRDYWNKPDPRVADLIKQWRGMGLVSAADIGCGIGRHALAMAEAGFSVTALDSSEIALEKLRSSCAERNLELTIMKGSYLERLLPGEAFDAVISYNVLYHGGFEEFKHAITLIRESLKPRGLFFMTCPTREDGKYGNGRKVGPHTYKPMNSVHPGDLHYFADEEDLAELLADFEVVSQDREEHYWDNQGIRQFSSYWQILVRKLGGSGVDK